MAHANISQHVHTGPQIHPIQQQVWPQGLSWCSPDKSGLSWKLHVSSFLSWSKKQTKKTQTSVLQEGEATLEKCWRCILVEFDREHQGHYSSSGHETVAGGKSGVLFLAYWRTLRGYIGNVWIQITGLVTSESVDVPLFLSVKNLLSIFPRIDTMQPCSWREWMHRSRASTLFMPGVTWPMHPSRSKSKCIVSDVNTRQSSKNTCCCDIISLTYSLVKGQLQFICRSYRSE